MNTIETGVIAGFAGGVARGLSSFLKKRKAGTSGKFNYSYFFTTVFFSGILGGIAGALAESNWKTAFFAGYAGMDFIENLYKSSPLGKLKESA
ncbi:MAG: hypothetical protein A2X28_11215 [Elusimicrobia bacterium GWA2_56_46]|jgi:hypothetical protein|nr:MAG: hypothetical protein A2X28_11215 [Elusimicrobia bacterium GWA2_56_46]OGR54506.1 MAG: hypothetical protein A2X39_10000 [Elusimicrobia bacterium GWC2_56_31]HBB68177.1 hypothetical protein [Elusimicrobiota bacterium]HBW22308.1 hypothetical protein [Elusimicrobiota bacterium]